MANVTIRIRGKFELKQGASHVFNSGNIFDNGETEDAFGVEMDIDHNVVNAPVDFQQVALAKRFFIQSDRAVYVKLVPAGYRINDVPVTKLIPGVPLIGGSDGLIGIYVSNTSGVTASVKIAAAGISVSSDPELPAIPTPTGEENLIYHFVTAGEIAAKKIVLSPPPIDPNLVLVDLIDGVPISPAGPSPAYEIVGAEFRWDGKGLDGVLSEGDELRFYYYS